MMVITRFGATSSRREKHHPKVHEEQRRPQWMRGEGGARAMRAHGACGRRSHMAETCNGVREGTGYGERDGVMIDAGRASGCGTEA
eukprot:6206142-Pleurochrysis_carterae.AAC.1